MEDLADAFIMMPGGIGTYEEFFEILTLKQLDQNHKPLVILSTNGYYDSLLSLLNGMLADRFMSEHVMTLVSTAYEPMAALSQIESEQTK